MQHAPRKRMARSAKFAGPLTVTALCWLAGCVATAEATAPGTTPSPVVLDAPDSDRMLSVLESRAARLAADADRIESRYDREIEPLASILAESPFASPENLELRTRIALALGAEARRRNLSATLLAAVLVVENPWLDLDKRSSVGAVGLMQVMPFHAGLWGCGSTDLEDLEVNICHGAGVFARDMRRSRGNVNRALLRYNGCVRGTNTPDCRSYPSKVYAWAEKVGGEG